MKLKKNIAKNNNQNNKNQIWHKKLIASFFLIWREWGVETNERREKGERKRKKKRSSALHRTSPNYTHYLKERHHQDDLNDIAEKPFEV